MNSVEHIGHSNIALVKYWGKLDQQIPCNPSLSFTLKNCITSMKGTSIEFDRFGLEFSFNAQENSKFRDNILSRMKRLPISLPNVKIKIESTNSFPHSSGIASSASSMSCYVLILNDLLKLNLSSSELSNYARLLSGSACRSLGPGFQSWGRVNYIQNSSDLYSSDVKVHSVFKKLRDTVIIVDSNPKKISSTKGHESMVDHPYRDARYKQAKKNHQLMTNALIDGNWDDFNKITRIEAMSLHALMMSSLEPYFLLHPKSLEMINLIDQELGKKNVTYTMDAGANIHLIYDNSYHQKVKSFLHEHSSHFEDFIEDEILI